jgi:nucleotide-binding universal stress UspA family protein
MNSTFQIPKPGSILLALDGSSAAKGAAFTATQIASILQWSIHAMYEVNLTKVFDMYSSVGPELSELGNDVSDKRRITLFEEQGTLAL